MKKVERKTYVQYKDYDTVYVDNEEVFLKSYISKLEKCISKGKCSSFEKNDIGYRYKLLDNDYETYEYQVDLIGVNDEDFILEMNRLYKLANSEVMVKRYKRKWKEIHTKPMHIILRNFFETMMKPLSMIGIVLASVWGSTLLTALAGSAFNQAIIGRSLMSISTILEIAKLAAIPVAGMLVVGMLYTIGRTIVKSIKEINDRKYKRYEEKEIVKNRTQVKEKKLEKEQVKEVTKSKSISKSYAPTQSIEESRTITYLRERYNMLAKERNRLITSNGSISEIQDITNQMKAILYRYNSMTNREDKANTYGGPVPKLIIK